MKGKFKLLDVWFSKMLIKHPLVLIFIVLLFVAEDMTAGEMFILIALIYLALVYSYRLQQYERDVSHYLSFGNWNNYKYTYERLNTVAQQYSNLKEEEEALRYKEIVSYKLKNSKLDGFNPSENLVRLNKKLWEIGKSYTRAEERRDLAAKSFLNQIKKISESDDSGWIKKITQGDKEPDFRDWKYYYNPLDKLDDNLAELTGN